MKKIYLSEKDYNILLKALKENKFPNEENTKLLNRFEKENGIDGVKSKRINKLIFSFYYLFLVPLIILFLLFSMKDLFEGVSMVVLISFLFLSLSIGFVIFHKYLKGEKSEK